ncbi:P-aminobenzoate N-oxygenase AurF [Pandoraea captiosa]|uniref:p-aminobenzoate N-oxygenase AurF n=1 Tax=Pandoraea captiosa TaxID=2508302 RepID=A0A5E4ZTG9_9BURK|nr:diiron oxygenase [Pandoraea captiosa]VVE64699.1 P-aminobenzoate N-oxygenase AurF [Pandoraea captiosa]
MPDMTTDAGSRDRAYGAPEVTPSPQRPWREVAAVTRCATEAPFPSLEPGHLFFNVSLMPYAMHPLVCELGQSARQRLSALRFEDYLNKTERVELGIVNRAIERMLEIPRITSVTRDDLLAIYTDEGFHTWMMERFRGHCQRATGYVLAQGPSLSVARVQSLCDGAPMHYRDLAIIAAACVTETLITTTLRQAGAGDDIYPPVRMLLTEHGADELRHQAAFVHFSGEWLPSLPKDEGEYLDALLPELMTAFLAPEIPVWHDHLCEVGLDALQADRVLGESIDPLEVGIQMMEAALVPRRLFERLGLSCAERFAQHARRWRPPR